MLFFICWDASGDEAPATNVPGVTEIWRFTATRARTIKPNSRRKTEEFLMDETTMNTQQPTNSTPEVNGGQAEKMFTQDDVNRIVSERLAREREKQTQQPQEDEREKALREREEAIAARENRYRCEDYLKERNMLPKDQALFLEALDTSDFESFKKIVDILGKPFFGTITVRGACPANPPVSCDTSADAQISAAFKPKKSF